ncbi:hypothetical protein LOC70_03815 [Rhodopirellula sp. JC737]|nr:hypothetical protein [Rhodopirellula sp. JC737]
MLFFAGYLFVTLPTTIHLTLPANHRTPSQTMMTSSPHARYAICLIVASLASYFHFRWYWGLHPLLCDATPFVTKLALAAVGLSIGYLGVVLFMTS